MGCNCGGAKSGQPAETYVVRKANGQTETVSSKVAADILVTKHGGSYSVQKK